MGIVFGLQSVRAMNRDVGVVVEVCGRTATTGETGHEALALDGGEADPRTLEGS
jgi:hypothetical protein